MQNVQQYQSVPQIEPQAIQPLDVAEMESLGKLLAGNSYVAVVENHLVAIQKPTGFFEWIKAAIWKPQNQRFANIASFVKERLVRTAQHFETLPEEQKGLYLEALEKLTNAYDAFLLKKSTIPSNLRLPSGSLIQALNSRQIALLQAQGKALASERSTLANAEQQLQTRQTAVSAHEAAILSLEQLQQRSTALQVGITNLETDIKVRKADWQAEMIRMPISQPQHIEQEKLRERELARKGDISNPELDCVFRCRDSEGQEVTRYAHSKFLTRYDYFKTQMSGDWDQITRSEMGKHILHFEEYPVATIDHLLDWIYTGKIEKFDSVDLINLYTIAHQVNLPDLKKICRETLQNTFIVQPALVYSLMTEYWKGCECSPNAALVDLFFDLLPDFCNSDMAEFGDERSQLLQLIEQDFKEKESELAQTDPDSSKYKELSDVVDKYGIIMCTLKNPSNVFAELNKRFKDQAFPIVLRSALGGYAFSHCVLARAYRESEYQTDLLQGLQLPARRGSGGVDNREEAFRHAYIANASSSLYGGKLMGDISQSLVASQLDRRYTYSHDQAFACYLSGVNKGYAPSLEAIAHYYSSMSEYRSEGQPYYSARDLVQKAKARGSTAAKNWGL